MFLTINPTILRTVLSFGLLAFHFLLAQETQAAGVGRRWSLSSSLQLATNQSAQVFVPDYYIAPLDGKIVLVFHMHGGTGAAEDQVYKERANAILFNIQLNGLSGVYQTYFGDSSKFSTITNLVLTVLRTNNVVTSPQIGKLIVSSFSAGYAGIREVLKTPGYFNRINGLMLADSLHGDANEATRMVQMQDFFRFATDARDGERIFLLTHSSVVTPYASTTVTANDLVSHLGASWVTASAVDAVGTQYRICTSGSFEAKGYSGTDHSAQYRGMNLMLRRAMQLLAGTPEINPPVIITHPERQSVKQGASVTLDVLASGVTPLSYQWNFNNTNILGATDSSLTLANLQSSNSGFYRVVVSNAHGSVTSFPAPLVVSTRSYPLLFSENFETNSASRWNLFWGADNNMADYTVEWDFDYGQFEYTAFGESETIPPAPSSSGTKGVRLTVNNNDAAAQNAGVNIYPAGLLFSGNYAVKCDLWMNYPGGAAGAGAVGSTEMALFGLNHLGTQANWMAASAASTDGLWFAATGEGGTVRDYRAYRGNLAGLQTELVGPSASGLVESNNTATFFQNLFPPTHFESSGSPGKRWVEVELSQSNNVIAWKMNGVTVAQRTNTSTFTEGKFMLGYMDPFTSIASPASNAFVLFDNVRVEDLNNPIEAPGIAAGVEQRTVRSGTNVTLSVSPMGSAPFTYQWQFNGTNIVEATGSACTLTNVRPHHAGTFSVVVSNLAGSVTSPIVILSITSAPPALAAATISSNQLQFDLSGDGNSTFAIQASTNLMHWVTVTNVFSADGVFRFTEEVSASEGQRFYRALVVP